MCHVGCTSHQGAVLGSHETNYAEIESLRRLSRKWAGVPYRRDESQGTRMVCYGFYDRWQRALLTVGQIKYDLEGIHVFCSAQLQTGLLT